MHRLALACVLIALGFAAPTSADTPPGSNSTIPSHVVLVGLGAAGPDSATGHCTVTVRDLANNPVPGSVVILDFSACADVAPAANQHDPRLTVNCAQRQVFSVTDENGVARFTVLGSGAAGPPSQPFDFKVFADGVLLGSPRLAVLERDGAGGLTALDLSMWAADLFSASVDMRADLNGDGYVSVLDLSVWASAYFNGGNTQPMGALCP